MGKKYLDTKKNSLEQSILGVWKTAVEEGSGRMDGRTTQYREHRKKLESVRERRASTKTESYEIGTDEYRKHMERITPGENIEEGKVIFDDHDTDDDDFKALVKKLSLKVKTKGDETTVSGNDPKISKMLKTMRMKKDRDGYAVLEGTVTSGE